MIRRPRNLYLTGFSASGKSTIGPLVAAKLGWQFADLDREVEKNTGRTIPDLFSEGELVFRSAEAAALRRVAGRERQVVATGGGAPVDPANRALMKQSGQIVCLECQPVTVVARLSAGTHSPEAQRPLLSGHDPLARVTFLKEARQSAYADCDWTIHTDVLTPAECAEEVARATALLASRSLNSTEVAIMPSPRFEAEAPYSEADGAIADVDAPGGRYPIFIGWQTMPALGRRVRNAGIAGRVFVISDTTVWALYGETVRESLSAAGLTVTALAIPPGESSKSLAQADQIFDWLVAERAERKHAVLAFGGGVVGDLAGFVAATYLRGLPFVQVPTTALAMVDSAIGGKVAVNHRAGKNLLGAFYQPRLVFGDAALLATLSDRDRVAGWAEIVKHALILDHEQFGDLEATAPHIADLASASGARLIARSAAIKARVVSLDEREQGPRMLLNYGHTAGHALEACTGYARFLHGEAISVGMEVAAGIAQRLGMLNAQDASRQHNLLAAVGLPVSCNGVDPDEVWAAMRLDKKVENQAVRWVLLQGIGRAAVRADVPPALARQAFDQVVRR